MSKRCIQNMSVGLLLTLLSACSNLEPVTCEEYKQCPAGWSCSTGTDAGHICINNNCGNRILDKDEACDDGNVQPGDGCSQNCLSKEECGNNIVDETVGEECDYGDTTPGDGCSSTCRIERCGNTIPHFNEACDDGNNVSGDGCSHDCKSNESCGNGIIDEREPCDCGRSIDSLNKTDENCKTPNSDNDGYCNNDCELHCGDGKTSQIEECDPNDSQSLREFCAGLSESGITYDMGIVTECSSCQLNLEGQCSVLTSQESNPPPEADNKLAAAMGSSVSNIFAVGTGRLILRYDGNTWAIESNALEAPNLSDVWVNHNGSTVLAVGGDGTILERMSGMQGIEWQSRSSSTDKDLYGVWGNNEGIYAVGAEGTILRHSGNSWTSDLSEALTDKILYDVWGYSKHVFAVGENGTLLHRFDGNWYLLPGITNKHLRAIWGSGGYLFIVGDESTIIRVKANTSQWEPMKVTPTTIDLQAVWGTSHNDVLAVGAGGHVFHYNGNEEKIWAPVRVESKKKLHTVWAGIDEASSEAIIVGDEGTFLHFRYPRTPH